MSERSAYNLNLRVTDILYSWTKWLILSLITNYLSVVTSFSCLLPWLTPTNFLHHLLIFHIGLALVISHKCLRCRIFYSHFFSNLFLKIWLRLLEELFDAILGDRRVSWFWAVFCGKDLACTDAVLFLFGVAIAFTALGWL